MTALWEPDLDDQVRHYRDIARKLTRERFAPLAEELDRDQRYPWEHIPVLVESGLAGLFVPEEFGGRGAGVEAAVTVMEELGRGCGSTSAIISAYLLGAMPILLEGSPTQQRRYLSELAREGNAVSFALTEREAGSDAASIATRATPEGEGWRITGDKCFIGNGGASRYYVVFAKTDPDSGGRGITAFVVDRESPGVTIDLYEDKMGLRGTLTSNLRLDTFVSRDCVVGEINHGLRLALKTLMVGRIGAAAQALGTSYAALDDAVARAQERHQFGRPIMDNQAIAFRLADVVTDLSAARMLTYQAARDYDRGRDAATLGAMAKLSAAGAAHRAVDAAVQVFGGYGFCKPTAVERYYRDQRITEIWEGTSEIQRLVISRALRT